MVGHSLGAVVIAMMMVMPMSMCTDEGVELVQL